MPAVTSLSVNVQAETGFACFENCDPTITGFTIRESNDDDKVDMLLTFSQTVSASDSSATLRSAFVSLRGERDADDGPRFVSSANEIELLENAGGRLHVVGWGEVYLNGIVVPAAPHVCGNEHPTLCADVGCDYSAPDTTSAYAWVHYDFEAPLNNY